MQIHESAENYLETILMLWERQGQVRSIDIVNKMGFTKSSISVAMKHLRENGYIQMDCDGLITLSGPGMKIARRIYTRHILLTKFLIRLGVTAKTAEADACKMEHDLSDETFERIREYAAKYLED